MAVSARQSLPSSVDQNGIKDKALLRPMTTQRHFQIRKPSSCKCLEDGRESIQEKYYIYFTSPVYIISKSSFLATVGQTGLFLELPKKTLVWHSSEQPSLSITISAILVSQSLLLSTFSTFTLSSVFSSHFFTSCHLIPTSDLLYIFVMWMTLILTCCNCISHFRQSNMTHVFTL